MLGPIWTRLWNHNAYCNSDRRVLACLVLTSYILYSWYYFWVEYASRPPVFQSDPISMELTGTKLWDDKNAFHSYDSNNIAMYKAEPAYTKTCDEFFALWPSDCVDRFQELDEKMRLLSAQMVAMNSTLTLFTTEQKQCEFPYPGILVNVFNATELLVAYGFASALRIMATWPQTRYTRLSDILRIALAHKHSKSYLDTDVTFLLLSREQYERPYAGAAMWSNAKNAIEITNAAFCLPSSILSDMLAFQKSRIVKGSHSSRSYFYTELGPSMFHNVLMNRYPVTLYSQNHPAQPSLDAIARDVHVFGHRQLHLTGHVRKGNPNLSFSDIVGAIRAKAGLPALVLPPISPGSQRYITSQLKH